MLGIVDLTTRAGQANPLMLPLAKRAAWEIEQRLLDDTPARERTLRRHFFEARRRAKVALVVVNDHTILTNTAAAALVDSSDRAHIWDWAQQAFFGRRTLESTVTVRRGTLEVVGCEPITDGGQVVGAALQVTVPSPSGDRTLPSGRRSYRERPAFGWASLTDAERSVAATVAEGLTNAEAGARLYLSPHTVNFHLRQIFASSISHHGCS
jgi:DNA-binding CsgD family transcriptional regulator